MSSTIPIANATVFMSYSRADSLFVDRLVDDLKANQIDVWVDRNRNYGGVDWPIEIQSAIDASDALIVTVSDNARQSQWVHREVHYAISTAKPIIPVTYLQVNPAAVFLEISALHRIDFTHTYQDGLHELIQSILHVKSAISAVTDQKSDECRHLPIAPHLLAVLNIAKDACRFSNVAFHTPNLLLSLLEVPGGAADRCFDSVCTGLADEMRRRLRSYISTSARTHGSGGYSEVVWEERSDVQAAQQRAWQEGAKAVLDKHLLLGILDIPSNTQRSLREFLGIERFQRLIYIIESTTGNDDGTPGIDVFFK